MTPPVVDEENGTSPQEVGEEDSSISASTRVNDRLLRALPPSSKQIGNEQFLSLGSALGVVNISNSNQDNNSTTIARKIENSSEEESIFESSFDLTEERLRYIFSTFNDGTEEQGARISYESLRKGFHDWQERVSTQEGDESLAPLEEDTFQQLVAFLDSDNSGDISFEEFAEGFRLLMLRVLVYQQKYQRHQQHVAAAAAAETPSSSISLRDAAESAPLEVLDYDATKLERTIVGETTSNTGSLTPWSSSGGSMSTISQKAMSTTDFYFQRRSDWVTTRWIDVITADNDGMISESAAALTLKRLAVKYLLHPLALEDALASDTHRPKVEVFSSHYFLLIPAFQIEEFNDSGGGVGGAGVEVSAKICCTWWRRWLPNLCGNRRANEESKKEESRRLPRIKRLQVEMVSIFVNVPNNNTLITFHKRRRHPSTSRESSSTVADSSARPVPSPTRHFFSRVQRELQKSYSKLRQYDAQYLTYALLDQAVDQLVPIITTMRREIAREKDMLEKNQFRRGLSRLSELQRELEKVCRRIKPFFRVLTHAIEDDAIVPGATIYLRDVRDNLECAEDELRQLVEACEALHVESDKYHARQMDRTLYTLTVVSTIFLPAQFLTGVWGMNFQEMPELERNWGYPVFWALTITMTCTLLLAFNFGRMPSIERE